MARPHLLGVVGLRAENGAVWVVSELDDGVCLRRVLEVVSLTPGQALVIAHAVVSGLAELHGAGLVHGRLHAGNVHLAADGRVRLGDGGLAAATDEPVGVAGRRRDLDDAAQLLRCALATGVPSGPAAVPAARQRSRLFAERVAQALDDAARRPHASAVRALPVIDEIAGEELAPPVQERARAQLAALIRPLLRPGDAAPALPAVRVAAPRAPGPRPRRPWRRWWLPVALLACAALAVLAGLEFETAR